jgi:hypothetical protein
MGWGDFDDGPLLDAMADRFDALITVDKSLPKQQNVSQGRFGVVLLRARSNRLAELLPLVPDLIEILKDLGPGETRELGVGAAESTT